MFLFFKEFRNWGIQLLKKNIVEPDIESLFFYTVGLYQFSFLNISS